MGLTLDRARGRPVAAAHAEALEPYGRQHGLRGEGAAGGGLLGTER